MSILDLIRVAQQLGKRVPPNSPVDINGDGVVNIFDLTLVAQGIGKSTAAAPAGATRRVDAATIEAWIAGARLADDGSIAFRQGIANLESLLASLIIPQETALHANYPNPFNPETWIPYQLATPAEVMLTIYDMTGSSGSAFGEWDIKRREYIRIEAALCIGMVVMGVVSPSPVVYISIR